MSVDEVQFQLDGSQTAKLTDWPKEPTIEILRRDFEACRNSHAEQVAKILDWNDMLAVRGEHKPKPVKGRSKVQPKLVRRQAEWRYSALTEPFLSTPNVFKVSPATYDDVQAAEQNGQVLNWQFRTKLNRIKFIDDLIRSTVDDGTCIVKIGWKRVTVPVTQQAPVWQHYPIQDPQGVQTLQQAIAAKQENPRAFENQAPPEIQQAVSYYEETNQPTTAVQSGTQDVQTDEVLENRPVVQVLFPENIFIDPSCNGDISKAMFAIESFDTSQAELKKEPKRYKNLEKVDWAANSPSTEPNHVSQTPADFAIQDKLRRKVVAYEYWGFFDVHGTGSLTPIVVTWIGNTIIRMEVNPYPDQKLPYVVIPYMPKKRELYGEPDAELLGDNQKILGALMRGMIDLLGKSANGQQGMAKGMLDPLNKRRYEAGEDYEFNPNMNPTNGVIEHKFPELPRSALEMSQLVNQEAEALTGVKSFSGGLSGSAYGDVATAIRGVLDAASKRESAILRRIAQGMNEIGDKIIAMNSLFLSEEEVVAVTDEQFVKIKREDLAGNFHTIVDIATAEQDNAKAQDLAFMIQTCGPNVGPDILLMILSEIAELKRMPELAHKLRNYKPPPPSPEQQQLMQLQLQEAQLKVKLVQSEIQLNQARAAAEGARSQLTSAQKDKTNLDYVEQETGTTHVRDMQKIESQAMSNQNLEVTKALLAKRKPEETAPNIHAAIGFNQLTPHLMNGGP